MKVAMQCPECHSTSGLNRVRRRWHEKSLTITGQEKLQCPDCQSYFMRGLGQQRLLYIGNHNAVAKKVPEFEYD
ncbi:hypothetical protein ACFFLZ_08360 [Photobacterium aphoticum]|uniref:Uncharacterized protein n=1 Tax=Photobacterium aphoticum TaxID=754436 RepID=A0A090QMJ7_9GAMM|nr:hypothetical protein [Photobacterium aphoticum]KLU99106.1 hypothetical protein ABT58_19025 [Photobacterium aphoticum]PSU59105.1 hypothetical protein C9I90_04965 [Photobacterium aphoticum]GAL04375.1 hypothetical protein JCM19237_1047 [Photobacterium aphoticum]GHA45583.1 hypothetical protein GCM10007086_18930 [Photobacterium aphoticum]